MSCSEELVRGVESFAMLQNGDHNGQNVNDISKRRSGRIRTKAVTMGAGVDDDENDLDYPAIKRLSKRKAESPITLDGNVAKKPARNGSVNGSEKLSRCAECRQYLNSPDLRLFTGDPDNAIEEIVMLTDPRLSLLNNDADIDVDPFEERPQHRITDFSVYDKNTHLCPFDTGLIEKNVELYFSGCVKPIYDDDCSAEGGVPTRGLGPINEWWAAGFDGGENALIGFSTAYADYILMTPSSDYKPFMEILKERIYVAKLVIEFLDSDDNNDVEFEDLLNKLQVTVPPKGISNLTEDTLLRHAQFIVDQVQSLDAAATDDNGLLLVTPCMRTLIKLAGVTLGARRALRRQDKVVKPKKVLDTKAMTTPMVKNIFENFFPEQIDQENQEKGPSTVRRQRCSVCEYCQQSDCGKCSACRSMLKFGGSGKSKQACIGRRCPNMVVKAADDDEQLDESDDNSKTRSRSSPVKRNYATETKISVKWKGSPVKTSGNNTYYDAAIVNGELINVGDYVLVNPDNPATPLYVAIVKTMWKNSKKDKCYFHAQWFIRGSDTVLGETSDPLELFLVDQCEDVYMAGIKSKCSVTLKLPPPNWFMLGGIEETESPVETDDGKSFFYQKWYDPETARFEDPPCATDWDESVECPTCLKLKKLEKEKLDIESLMVDGVASEVLSFNGVKYHVGDCVYLNSEKYTWFVDTNVELPDETSTIADENLAAPLGNSDMYPESYRKTSDHGKWQNMTIPNPFAVGCIVSINGAKSGSKPKVRVRKFYRPKSTYKVTGSDYGMDMNCIFWSNDECDIHVDCIEGKCYVAYSENIEDLEAYRVGGPNRFYFSSVYSKNKFEDSPPSEARAMGIKPKGKGKGQSATKRYIPELEKYPSIKQPLRSLDVFAGCGGLSEGFHQSGVSQTMWAIEKDPPAAQAFRLNNPNSTVFLADVNEFLRLVVDGEKCDELGQTLPQKGDVELLCGGPPCQGFSGMNRFNSRQYSLFKNSLVVSLLSFCDYYRPRFFVLENVRNFVSFKRSMVLKLALRCLVRMGYQCTFAILQAGQYGIPQTRRRAIILAAAPGEKLPTYPEPTHVFPTRVCKLSVVVDDVKLVSNIKWADCAPYHAVNVSDAMSDLPDINEFHNQDGRSRYACDPITHFQTIMRGPKCPLTVSDHVCKEMNGLILARLKLVPRNSDWRDLPNIVVRLPDGSHSKKLMYTHHDKKNGLAPSGALRGVCVCASGKPCDPLDHQTNTIIPWCLPHTANRHNNWAGLYGRLEWTGFFSTTVTNPEPMGKQGRVLHPEYHRVVSVRECARSQGFRDSYRFFGTVIERHRQIGNAVPPPMAAAIGMEIKKSVMEVEDH